MFPSLDTLSHPERDARCPRCRALRDSPIAACDRCDYDPDPISDRDPEGANEPGDPDAEPDARSLSSRIGDGLAGALFLLVIAIASLAVLFADPSAIDRGIVRAIAWVIS